VVKSGDSLARIAKSHGTTVKALKAANGLKSDNIVAGKKLKIPQVVKPLASVTKG
jgi:membrane-bound lytic murein transglycosylase D